MKKIIILTFVLTLLLSMTNPVLAANDITERLLGRLLLQVEGTGQIWWVNPQDMQKYEVTFANAMDLFKSHALGISNNDLAKLQVHPSYVHPSADADGDGYTDREELAAGYNPFGPGEQNIDHNLAKRLAGRFLLQVEDMGRVWYMNPVRFDLYEVKFATLMDLFRGLALGITDEDLSMVGQWKSYTNNELGFKFDYPPEWGDVIFNQRDCGDSGKLYRAEFTLNKGVYFGGNSIDCREGRGAIFLDFCSYRFAGDQIVYSFAGKEDKFTPSEILTLSDESKAIVIYDQELGLHIGKSQMGAYINLKNNEFPGIAFFANEKERSRYIFKEVLSTFKFIEDWQTYRNTEYGYEVKYPSSWEIDNNRSTANEVVFYFGLAESREAIKVENSLGRNLDDWKFEYEGKYYIVSSKSLTIDGVNAYRLDSTEFGLKYIIALNNGYLYTVTTGGYMIDNGMLSTFKFLD